MEQRFDAGNPMQVGGQAVIEGVMMRAPGMVATAVRRPDGSIAVRKDPYTSLAERNRVFKLPVLRGAVGLIEMLVIGLRTLNYSAEVAMNASEEAKAGDNGSHRSSRAGDSLRLALTLTVALGAGVAIFFLTPLVLTTMFFSVDQQPLAFNLIAGGIRLVLFLGYLIAIAALKDVQRIFEYHGAEHKAVFAFERGGALEPDAAACQSRFHPRCGTSFLLVVMLVAILMFGLFDAGVIALRGSMTLPLRIATHLPLIPLLGGISYEFIRISARHSGTALGRIIVAPGLWLQKITTREPDTSELEVAVAALRAARGEDLAEPVAAIPKAAVL